MHRMLVEMSATLGAGVVIVAGVLAAGGHMEATPLPIPVYVAQPAGCLDTPVFALDNSGVIGRARLCIVDEGVRPAADVEGLNPGTAYAAWLAYFDRPQECQKLRCTIEDLRGENAVGVAGRMDGMVADGIRKAQFHGDFRDLRVASGSELSLFVFERGPVSAGDSRARAQQLLTLQLPGPNVPSSSAAAGGGRPVAQAAFSLP
ncbi:MAG: hypothetical protein M3N47_02750 [Chloroflexota bacterium]|nr:hypothetical protein [Chloroflexota bacterium]